MTGGLAPRLRAASRSPALGVFAAVAILAVLAYAATARTVRQQERALLERRAAEVRASVEADAVTTAASMQLLASASQRVDPGSEAFGELARPLLTGQARSLILATSDDTSLVPLAVVGDNTKPIGPQISGSRARLMARSLRQVGLNSGIVRDGDNPRLAFVLGPEPKSDLPIIELDFAIDPTSPQPLTDPTAPFADLDIQVYASPSPHADALILASDRGVMEGSHLALTEARVGNDRWTVEVRAREPLVGGLTRQLPWIVLAGGLIAAMLAGAVIATLGRRRNYALTLVDERTSELQRSLRENEAAKAALTTQAHHDSLTGLPNRVLFNQRLDEHAARP